MSEASLAAPRHFRPLEQADFQRLQHAPYLKGLLKPFNGKGSLETWANQCTALRDDLIALAQRHVLQQTSAYPFRLLPIHLAQQTTGAGTTFLRWRNLDRSAMGVTLWSDLVTTSATPERLVGDLYAIELQRIALNMQISLLHTLSRQAQECASKMARAETVYLRRLEAVADSSPHQGPPAC